MKKTFIILSALLLSSTPALSYTPSQARTNKLCSDLAGLKGTATQDNAIRMGFAFAKDKNRARANMRAAYNQCPWAFNVYSTVHQYIN